MKPESLNKQLDFQEIRTNATNQIENIHKNRTNISLLCDTMTDVKNVGSMFRLADAARLKKLYFYQSTVNFTNKKLTKVARSTNKYVDFELINDFHILENIISNYEIVALDKTSESIDYMKFKRKLNKELLLIIGAERFGVSPELLSKATSTIHLPMLGVNTSMNVSVATGIAVYHLRNLL